MTKRSLDGPTGVVVVDKPRGPTSFDVVAQARRVFGTRRVGHCGTLDPMATGVLVLVLGEATKLSNVLSGADKAYQATVRFGHSTDTLDAEGSTVGSAELAAGWSLGIDLEAHLLGERERRTQVPPQFSAIKLDGQPAYARARKGQNTELAPRDVRVRRLLATHFDDTELRVELDVSKGYYVRSLARDLCERLGVPGHLSSLRRTRSGCFDLNQAHAWPPAQAPAPLSQAQAASLAMATAMLTVDGEVRARQGKTLSGEDFVVPPDQDADPTELVAWLSTTGSLVALGRLTDDGYRVVRGFVERKVVGGSEPRVDCG